MFHETGDRGNFQGRYVVRHPFKGPMNCDAGNYRASVRERQEREAKTLASLTGWSLADIRARIPFLVKGSDVTTGESWWQRLWN